MSVLESLFKKVAGFCFFLKMTILCKGVFSTWISRTFTEKIFVTDWCHKRLKNTIDLLFFYQFMICSLYNNVQVIFEFKVNFFLLFHGNSSWMTVIMTLIWLFFHCHEMILKRSETVNLHIILSNFRMFWNSFCSKVRKGVGVEPILTKKLASLP